MQEKLLSIDQMVALKGMDTPWVCNALELVDSKRRLQGYTTESVGYVHPGVTRLVGYARTARLRTAAAYTSSGKERREKSLAYYSYIEKGGPQPSVCVIQDVDEAPGLGALWGEVNTTVHHALGCAGVITNGGVRDLDECAPGFQMLAGRVTPSHAYMEIVDFGQEVVVFGLAVKPGAVIHADKHGAVAMSVDEAVEVIRIGQILQRKEAITLAAARRQGFTADDLRAAYASGDDIH